MLDKTFAYLQFVNQHCDESHELDPEMRHAALDEVKLLRSMPEVVMLAGSARFKLAFEQVAEAIALQGKIVIGKSVFKPGDDWPLDERAKSLIHAVQFRTCDLANRLHIVNVDGYVGQDTYNLIRYAMRTERVITFHEQSVALLDRSGQGEVSAEHFLKATKRRVEFEEAALSPQ